MIERAVFVRLKRDCSDRPSEVAAHTRQALGAVPGVLQVTVGTPADDHAAAAWDLCILVRFAALADAERYRDHPEHRRYVDQYLAPRMAVIKAWNFDVSG